MIDVAVLTALVGIVGGIVGATVAIARQCMQAPQVAVDTVVTALEQARLRIEELELRVIDLEQCMRDQGLVVPPHRPHPRPA